MQIELISQADYLTTAWDGGTTTQFYILPQGLTVKEDFLFRISSATVQSGDSTFSDFSGYRRFLTVLEGGMFIRCGDDQERYLDRLEPLFFDGSVPTSSYCAQDSIDFNIIWKNHLDGVHIEIIHHKTTIESKGVFFFYATKDNSRVKICEHSYSLNRGEMLKLNSDKQSIAINGEGISCWLDNKNI